MSSVLNYPDTGIRKVTGLDFGYIRKLPVQLTPCATSTLLLKQLRMMMQVPDYELYVLENEKRISAFMALQYCPAHDSAMRFLVVKNLALDRFAFTRGTAAEMEDYACQQAKATGCAAVLVRASSLNGPAMKFYKERGYRQDGETLIKTIL